MEALSARIRTIAVTAIVGFVFVLAPLAANALDATLKCQAAKLKATGKLDACILGADSKAIKNGEAADYSKCTDKFHTSWQSALAKAGSVPCPSNAEWDSITAQAIENALKVGGVLSGARYQDTGLGTVIDLQTGLEWQKTDNGGGLTDKDNSYEITHDHSSPWLDGNAFTEFLYGLNDCRSPGSGTPATGGYAGQCDWRIPQVDELMTILREIFPGSGHYPYVDEDVFGPIAQCCGPPNYFATEYSTATAFTPRYDEFTYWRVDLHSGHAGSDASWLPIGPARAVRGNGNPHAATAPYDVKIHFYGNVVDVYDPNKVLPPGLHVGDEAWGRYTYNLGAPDTEPAPEIADYEYSTERYGIRVSVGDDFFARTDPDNVDFLVELVNDYQGDDAYLLRSYNNLPLENGTPVEHIAWQLDDPTMTALSSVALPATEPDLDAWDSIFGLTVFNESSVTLDKNFFVRILVDKVVLGQTGAPSTGFKAAALKATGKYGACLLNAESKALTAGGAASYEKCTAKFGAKWLSAQSTYSYAGSTFDFGSVSDDAIKHAQGLKDIVSGLRFFDTGLGTVIDRQTGLEWQKTDDAGGLTDKDNEYTWTASGADQGLGRPGGTVFAEFLRGLNNCESDAESSVYTYSGFVVTGGYAGYCDWRIPQIDELETLGDCSGGPCFNQTLFGPTAGDQGYWSATSSSTASTTNAWAMSFANFHTSGLSKLEAHHVRGVRGGVH